MPIPPSGQIGNNTGSGSRTHKMSVSLNHPHIPILLFLQKSALGGSRTHICLTHTRSLAGRICQFCYKGKMHPMGIEPIFHRKRSLNPLRLPVPPWAPNSGNRSRTCYLTGHEPRMVIRSTLPQGRQQGSNLRQADYKSAALPSELCRHILKNEIFKEHLRRGYESA